MSPHFYHPWLVGELMSTVFFRWSREKQHNVFSFNGILHTFPRDNGKSTQLLWGFHSSTLLVSALFRDNDEYKLIWSMSDMITSLHHKIKRLDDLRPHTNSSFRLSRIITIDTLSFRLFFSSTTWKAFTFVNLHFNIADNWNILS